MAEGDSKVFSLKNVWENGVIVLLNSPEHVPMEEMTRAWQAAKIRVVSDGGAHLAIKLSDACEGKVVADVLVGDFDSVEAEDLEIMGKVGTKVIKLPSQDVSDLYKGLAAAYGLAELGKDVSLESLSERIHELLKPCIEMVSGESEEMQIGGLQWPKVEENVGVLNGLGGRLDHVMQSVNALHVWSPCFSELWLVGSHSAAMLCPASQKTTIRRSDFESKTCGLIPFGSFVPKGHLETTGLEWNISREHGPTLQWGGCLSTSNHAIEPIITINLSSSPSPLVWTPSLNWSSSS